MKTEKDHGGKQTAGRRSLAKKFALLLATFPAMVLILEIGLRVYFASPMDPVRVFPFGHHARYTVMPDPDSGYRLRPYFEGRMVHPLGDFNVKVQINSKGLRDHHQPDPTRFTIWGVGDSYTFGVGVEEDETYEAQMEALYNEFSPKKIQYINMGVPAFSIKQAHALLSSRLGEGPPDMVTLLWAVVNFGREHASFVYSKGFISTPDGKDFLSDEQGKLRFMRTQNPWLRRIDLWGQSHSFVYTFFKYRVGYWLVVKWTQ